MKMSEQVDKIMPAIAKAQTEMDPVAKDATNPHFRSAYTKIEKLQEAARPILAKHGLGIVQAPAPSEPGVVALETMVIHLSGQWVSETATVPISRKDPQTYCAAVTYARRYGMASMLNITCDNDDDGNTATPKNGAPKASDEAVALAGITTSDLADIGL